MIGSYVCKETVAGGAKTCQYETACTQHCSVGQFCDAANLCQYGMLPCTLAILYQYHTV